MSNYKISDKQKLNIIAERQNGKSIKEIAKTYKVSRQTISAILNDNQTLQNLTQTLQNEKEEVILKWSTYWNRQSKIGQEISTKAFELLKSKMVMIFTKYHNEKINWIVTAMEIFIIKNP